jgi:hypothetical protein
MNYKDYKKLSKEDKEEYSFLFGEKVIVDIHIPLFLLIILTLLICMSVLVSFMIINDPIRFGSMVPNAIVVMKQTSKLANITAWVGIPLYIFSLLDYIIYQVRKYIWIKKHQKSLKQ